MTAPMFIKMSVLLTPTYLLACTGNLFLVILAIGWIPASYMLAKKWHSKAIDKLAKHSIIKSIIDA